MSWNLFQRNVKIAERTIDLSATEPGRSMQFRSSATDENEGGTEIANVKICSDFLYLLPPPNRQRLHEVPTTSASSSSFNNKCSRKRRVAFCILRLSANLFSL